MKVTMIQLSEQLCAFKRSMCLTHKIKGNKKTVTSKKWSRLKNGYRWVTTKKIEYSWDYKMSNISDTQDMNIDKDDCRSPAVQIFLKFMGIFCLGGRLRNSEDSLKVKVINK